MLTVRLHWLKLKRLQVRMYTLQCMSYLPTYTNSLVSITVKWLCLSLLTVCLLILTWPSFSVWMRSHPERMQLLTSSPWCAVALTVTSSMSTYWIRLKQHWQTTSRFNWLRIPKPSHQRSLLLSLVVGLMLMAISTCSTLVLIILVWLQSW